MKGIPRGLAVSLPRFVVSAVLLGGLPAQNARVVPASAGSSVPPSKEPRSVPDPEHMTRPKYPKESLQAGVEGAVELRAIVGPNGRTQGLTVVNGKPVFAMPALEAVRKWHFHSVVVEGKPVETTYKIRVRFVLLFQEAVPDWEIESPHDTAAIANSALRNLKRDTPDGPVSGIREPRGSRSEAGLCARTGILGKGSQGQRTRNHNALAYRRNRRQAARCLGELQFRPWPEQERSRSD